MQKPLWHERLEQSNELIQVIANCGRKFFAHNGNISRFEIDHRGHIWFIDSWSGKPIYISYTGRWRDFSEGDTLREVVIRLRDYIRTGKQCGKIFGPYPDWYSGGDPWGYGVDMLAVCQAAVRLGMVEV